METSFVPLPGAILGWSKRRKMDFGPFTRLIIMNDADNE